MGGDGDGELRWVVDNGGTVNKMGTGGQTATIDHRRSLDTRRNARFDR
jgi:hypothetical protein